MKIMIRLMLAFTACLALFAGPASAQASKPNIMFIMADDIGWMQRAPTEA